MAKTSGKKNDSTSESNDETLITNYKIGCHQEIDLFFLRLTDAGGNRSLSIKIGDMDAQVLGLELPGQQSPILTLYHIIIAILDVQKVTVKKVVIYDHKEGRLISKLYLADEYEKNTVVESSVTHTVALAMIMRAPIYVKNKVFDLVNTDKHTIQWYDIDEDYTIRLLSLIPYEDMVAAKVEELEIYLNIAVQKENYELAKKIHAAIQQKINQQ